MSMFLKGKSISALCLLYVVAIGSLEASWTKSFAKFYRGVGIKSLSLQSSVRSYIPFSNKLWPHAALALPILGRHNQRESGYDIFKKYSLYALLGLGFLKATQQPVYAEEPPKITTEKASEKPLTLEEIAADNTFSDSISWRFFSKNFDEISRRLSRVHSSFSRVHKIYADGSLPLATIFSREAEYVQEYEVFYHAHTGSVRVLQDLFAELGKFFQEEKPENFVYLRDPIQNTYLKKTYFFTPHDEFYPLQWQREQESADLWWDSNCNIQKKVLSVNVHLFGNMLADYGESTIMYYARNHSARYDDEYMYKFLRDYDFKGYDGKMGTIISQCGNLLQIFIPKNKAKSCRYVAFPGGRAACENGQCMKYRSLLRRLGLTTTPAIQDGDNDLQARIILDHNIMLNSRSGVKIFRYTTMPKDVEKEYLQDVKKLATHIFIEWLERLKLGNVRADALERIDKTDLGQRILERSWSTGCLLAIPKAIDEEIAKLKADSQG